MTAALIDKGEMCAMQSTHRVNTSGNCFKRNIVGTPTCLFVHERGR